MALKGDLESIDLAHVFQMLTWSEKTGTLEILAHGVKTSLYFRETGVLYPYDRDTFRRRVLLLLVRAGRIDEASLRRAKETGRVRHAPVLDVLVEMGVVCEEEVEAAYREQMEEEIYDLFFATDATFEFLEGRRPEDAGKVLDERYVLPAQGLVMEAARRVDEWNYIHEKVGSDHCVFEVASDLSHLRDEDPAMAEVHAAIDGARSVLELVRVTQLPRYQVCKTLAQLLDARVIYEVPAEVLWERASKILRKKSTDDGLALLERAFEKGLDNVQAFELAAKAHQELGHARQAARYLGLAADRHERGGDREKAAAVRLQVRGLMPTHLPARRDLFAYYVEKPEWFNGKSYDALHEAVDLAWMLNCIGATEESMQVLLDYQVRNPGNWKSTQRLAQTAIDTGEPRVAVQILGAAADQYFQNRTWPQAARLYRQIRSIDPNFEDLERRLRMCQQGSSQAHQRSRRFLRVCILLLVVGALEFAYVNYSSAALKAFEELRPEELALQGEFDTALESLESFRTRYPVTAAGLVATDLMRDLEERRDLYEKQRHEDQETYAAELTRNQNRAEALFEEAMRFSRVGNHADALDHLKRANRLSTDPAWRTTVELDQKIAEMEQYLGGSEELFRQWQAQWLAEDWEAAHRTAGQLLRDYGLSPRVNELKLPLLVESWPPGALVHWEGAAAGDATVPVPTPALLRVKAAARGRLILAAPHYATATVEVDPTAQLHLSLRLRRLPALTGTLQSPPIHPPTAAGDRFFVSCASGRTVALDTVSGAELWMHKLPDLRELRGPPLVASDAVFAVAEGGMLFRYPLEPGAEVLSAALAAAPVGPAAAYRGVVVVPVEGSLLGTFALQAFNAPDLQRRWTEHFTGSLDSGPLPCEEGFLFAAGKLVVQVDGRSGKALLRWALPSEVRVLSLLGNEVWAGTEDGLLFRWPLAAETTPLLFSEAMKGVPVQAVQADGSGLYCVAGRDLLVLSPSGSVLRRRTGIATEQFVLCEAGIVVAQGAQEVVLLDRTDLRVLESYGLEDDAAFLSLVRGLPFVFGRQGKFFRLDS